MIEIRNLTKEFVSSTRKSQAVKNVSLTIEDGDIFGIIGKSGAGKSTLVRCINMLERPTAGTVLIDGVDMGKSSDKELRLLRRRIAVVFQNFNLLMQKNCLDNVCFPLELDGTPRKKAKERAMELLDIVGLGYKASSYPAQLSGGQQQRVAIARALATNPKVLLCDEATSALDPTTTNSILELIRDINEKTGISVIIITHQMSVVEHICKHVAILDHGSVVEMGEVSEIFSNPKTTAARELVYPECANGDYVLCGNNMSFVRVVISGAELSDTPVISRLALDHGIEATVNYSALRTVANKTFGSMIIGVKGGEEKKKIACEYLNSIENVFAQEVSANV